MEKKCVVPNCRSGYRPRKNENFEGETKPPSFLIPKSEIKNWQKAIPRKNYVLKPEDCVCEKHFAFGDY